MRFLSEAIFQRKKTYAPSNVSWMHQNRKTREKETLSWMVGGFVKEDTI